MYKPEMYKPESDKDHIYRGFSCPYESFDHTFFSLVVTQYATSLIDLLLDHFGAWLNNVAVGVTDLLANTSTDNPGEFEIFWSSAPATIMQALQTGEASTAQRAAAELLLHSGANKVPGDWEIQLEQPSVFLWQTWLLPKADRLVVQNDGSTARILASLDGVKSESRLYWSSEQGAWLTDDLKQLHKVADNTCSILLLQNEAVPDLNCDSPVVSQISSAHHEAIAQALQLLRDVAPRYHTWVTRVLRRLIIVESSQNILKSGNLDGYYGTFYISECLDPLLVAEMLVHESSHQYYHALVQLEDVTDKLDQTTYYSPFVKRQRPLDRLLLAYHAFANVYLFYQECFGSQMYGRKDRKGIQELANDLSVVEQPIMESDKVTPIGRALVEPLYREMHHA